MKTLKKISGFFTKKRCSALGLLAGSSLLSAGSALAADKPNIIFFFVDDLGWTDLNCRKVQKVDGNYEYVKENGNYIDNSPAEKYDSTYYLTPNIARLRQLGVRFTSAYAACPFCLPTRASVLTGKYPARLRMTETAYHPVDQINHKLVGAEYERNLPLTENTIAEALGNDYISASIGKWHVGMEAHYPDVPKMGFDYNIGGTGRAGPTGENNYLRPSGKWPWSTGGWNKNAFPNLENPNDKYKDVGWTSSSDDGYLTDALTTRAVEFIDIAQNKKKPFFLYMPHYAVHGPIQAKEQIISDYFTHGDPRGLHNNPVYAAMIKSVDESLGKIMHHLETRGILNKTIIIFFSDNGGSGKTSNTPLQSWKRDLFEGGVRVPMIAYWPGVTKPNSTCDVPVTSVDFFPTILEMSGIKCRVPNIDGQSLVPLLKAQTFTRVNNPNDTSDDNAIFWHVPSYRVHKGQVLHAPWGAVRQGNYKLIKFYEYDGTTCESDAYNDPYDMPGPVKLYDLSKDIGEHNNLTAEMPKKADELERVFENWLYRVNANLPMVNNGYVPK